MSRSRAMTYSKAITVAALGPVLALSLTACGGGSSAATVTPQANATGAPSAGAGGGGGGAGGFFNGAEGAKIQSCLKAAGVSLPTGRAFPRPSGSFVRPTGIRPSGVRPSGGAGRGFGGGGLFSDPQIQAALKACGIVVPTFGPRPSGAPAA